MTEIVMDDITLETATVCNARCIICPNGYKARPRHFMSLDEIESVLSLFKSLSKISLSGLYEPLLDPRFDKILSLIEEIHPNVKINVFTNASLLNKWHNEILNHNVVELICSVHGFSKEVYESVMMGLKRGKVYNNILDFMYEKGLGFLPITRVTFVRIRQNVHELEEFRDFWRNKVDAISDFEVMNWRGAVPFDKLCVEHPKHTRPCPMYEHGTVVIDAYGNVVRCCYCFDKNFGHVLRGGLGSYLTRTWDSNPHTFPKRDCMKCVGWRYY